MSDVLPFSSARALTHLGSILVSGRDARDYLQGQVSFDMQQLTPQRMELASCNSSQGRVQAVLWMIERSAGIQLILPAEIVDATAARLRKYVLRAKVVIESGAGQYVVAGTKLAQGLESPRAHEEREGVSLIRWPSIDERTLVIAPTGTPVEQDLQFETDWQLADIRSGLPQVYAQTQEQFVAQMLNVDLLQGISFEKGCYTGQEIIARTHFRGTVKRRMVAFAADCAPPARASRVLSNGVHAGDVVDAVASVGGCELLAVVTLSELQNELTLADAPGSVLRRLPMPYAVN